MKKTFNRSRYATPIVPINCINPEKKSIGFFSSVVVSISSLCNRFIEV